MSDILDSMINLQPRLPASLTRTSATGGPQVRRAATNFVVWHYNGGPAPARAGGNDEQICVWLRDVIIPNHISRIGADGVQYHIWIAADGTVYQVRDLDMHLWHCGNRQGNAEGIAIHIPVGGAQRPTDVQFQAACDVTDALIRRYGLPGRSVVKGHRELGASECPGSVVMAMLAQWRAGTLETFPRRMRVINGIDFAAVRVAPDIRADEATIGSFPVRLPPGFVVEVSRKRGRWYHITQPDAWGFSHDSLYEQVNADAPVGPPAVVPVTTPPLDDLIFVHPPRISFALFEQIMDEACSPAAPFARAMYTACEEEDVDPAIMLAFFRKESSYGTQGLCIAYDLKSPGNVRTPMQAYRGQQIQIAGRGPFFKFKSWEDGARDWGERMRVKYTQGLWLPTVRQALPTYAPRSDNNEPAQYAAQIVTWVRMWQQQQKDSATEAS